MKKVHKDDPIDQTIHRSRRESGLLSIKTINCDQVAWLYDALDRYIDTNETPAVSRAGEMKIFGCMYEIMEVLGLEFEDDAARNNGTPKDARKQC